MRFRKVICMALVGVMLILSMSVCAFASAGITFSEQFHADNGSVEYSIEISENSQISGLSMTIEYDQLQLKLAECRLGDVLSTSIAKTNSKNPGKVILTSVTMDPITQSGEVVYLRFDVVDTNQEKFSLDVAIDECIDSNCDDLKYDWKFAEKVNPLYAQKEDSADNSNQEDPDQNAPDRVGETEPPKDELTTDPDEGGQVSPGYEGSGENANDSIISPPEINIGINDSIGDPDTPQNNGSDLDLPVSNVDTDQAEDSIQNVTEIVDDGSQPELPQLNDSSDGQTELAPQDNGAQDSGVGKVVLWIGIIVVITPGCGVLIYFYIVRRKKR